MLTTPPPSMPRRPDSSADLPPDLPSDLDARLREDAGDDAEHAELRRVWHLLGRTAPDATASDANVSDANAADAPAADEGAAIDAAWTALQARLDADAPDAAPARSAGAARQRGARAARRPARRRVAGWRVAVPVVLALVLAGAAWWWTQPVRLAAAAGARTTATLPDGTTVELNSGTTLRHARALADWPVVGAATRTVHLRGEAFFDVATDGRPFVVETPNARVEVLGTQFNVRARTEGAEGPVTQVTLAEGRVRVRSAARAGAASDASAQGGGVVLGRPGAQARVRGADAAVAPADTGRVAVARVLAWRRAGFAVTDRPLPAVARELARRYDTTVRLAPGTPAYALTLYYPTAAPLETILADICSAEGLRYRRTSTGYVLEPATR